MRVGEEEVYRGEREREREREERIKNSKVEAL